MTATVLELAALAARDRWSPAKHWWVYHVRNGSVTVYRLDTRAGADAMVRLLAGEPGHAARTLWQLNLWHVRRLMGVAGLDDRTGGGVTVTTLAIFVLTLLCLDLADAVVRYVTRSR